MKRLFTLFAFTVLSAVTFAQAHTYNQCCRYGKGPVTGECVCPGCKQDNDNEKKALVEEARQQEEKAAQNLAADKIRIKKDEEVMAKEREDRIKDREKNTVYLEAPKEINRTSPDLSKNWEEFGKNIQIINGNFENHKNTVEGTIKVLYNKKIIFSTSEYTSLSILAPNLFLATRPWDTDYLSRITSNNVNVLNMKGEKVMLGSYQDFANVTYYFPEGDILKVYINGNNCVPYNQEGYKTAVKCKFFQLNLSNLSNPINLHEFLNTSYVDCNGN